MPTNTVTQNAVSATVALWGLLKDAVVSWIDDYAPSMGAALAFYTLFSLAPLLLIVISVAGLVFGEQAARSEIMAQLSGLVGPQTARTIESILEELNRPESSAKGMVFGVSVLLIGATTVVEELRDSIDRIWRAPPRPLRSEP